MPLRQRRGAHIQRIIRQHIEGPQVNNSLCNRVIYKHLTGKKFIHGQPVCLGVYIGSMLHDHQTEDMLAAIRRAGVDIRPQAMGITWQEVAETLHGLAGFVEQAGLWYTIANEAVITDDLITRLQTGVRAAFGPWGEQGRN